MLLFDVKWYSQFKYYYALHQIKNKNECYSEILEKKTLTVLFTKRVTCNSYDELKNLKDKGPVHFLIYKHDGTSFDNLEIIFKGLEKIMHLDCDFNPTGKNYSKKFGNEKASKIIQELKPCHKLTKLVLSFAKCGITNEIQEFGFSEKI